MLLALNRAFDREAMDLFLYLWQVREQEIWYSSDALLRFSGLIASGLVTFKAEKLSGQTPPTFGTIYHGASYEIGMKVVLLLTGKGKLLVEAWRNGDEAAYRALVSGRVPEPPATSLPQRAE
jgi:hypothetical protein